jgi:hypothetical protein
MTLNHLLNVAGHRRAFPLNTGRQVRRAVHAPQSLSAAVAFAAMRHHAFSAIALLAVVGCAFHSVRPITRTFPADRITKVVVRASEVQSATITTDSPPSTVEISGLPTGGARGYHPPNRNWRETPPDRWGLDFASRRHGDVLVISTKGEISYIHHHYVLDALRIRVPASVVVVRQQRNLNVSGEPDLGQP